MPAPQDAYSDLTLDQAGALGQGAPAAAPPLSFFDKVKLGYKQAGAAPDWGLNQADWRGQAMGEVMDALKKRGIAPIDPRLYRGDGTGAGAVGGWDDPAGWSALFGQVAAARAVDPNFLPDFAGVADKASFDTLVKDRRNARLAEIDAAAPDGLGAGGLVGALGHGLRDPTSYIPVGGGPVTGSIARQLLAIGVREAGANVAFTVATEPLVQKDAGNLGIERTMGDFAFDVGTSAAAGFVIGTALPAVHAGGAAVVDVTRPLDRKIAKAIEDAPLADVDVARAFARAVPRERRTPDQQAAIDVIERDHETRSASPFVEGPEGDDAHVDMLDLAMRSLAGDAPVRPSIKPVAREAIASGEADPASLRNPPRQTLKAKIHRAEATTSNDYNPASGATGPYQFVARTWVNLFKRRYPNDTRSFEQIAALRRDPALNEVLMDDLVAENAYALHVARVPETAGNLYLAHFLGHHKATAVLTAAPDTPIGRLLPDEYFADNPWLKRDWTAAKLAAWSDRKMGTAPGGRPGDVRTAAVDSAEGAGRVEADDPPAPDLETGRYDVEAMLGLAGDDRPVLKPDMFDSPEAHAAAQADFEAARDGLQGFASVKSADDLFDPRAHFAAVKDYAKSEGKADLDDIAAALGVRPDLARRVLASMQATDAGSPFIFTRREARLMRRPKLLDKGPRSLLEFLSERGGLKDTGGDLTAMDAQLWHKGGAFRRKLLQEDGAELDDAFAAAIDHGYFPHLNAGRQSGGTYADLPDTADFLAAIDGELRGRPVHRLDEHDELMARRQKHFDGEPEPEGKPDIFDTIDMGLAEQVLGEAPDIRFDDDMLVHAVSLVEQGMAPAEAAEHAAVAAMSRDLELAAAHSGEISYGIGDDGRAFDEAFARWAEGRDLEPDGEPSGAGGGRPEPARETAAADGPALEQSAHDPEAREFDDPVGPAAKAQADSIEHDLRMEAAGQLPDAGDRMVEVSALKGEVVQGPTANDLWRLSQEQLIELRDETRLSDDAKLVKALGGEGAKRFKSLDRTANGMDPKRADEASALMDKEFGNLTPEQDRLIYGIGEVEASVEELDQLIRAHSDVMPGDDASWSAYMGASAIRDASPAEIAQVPLGKGSVKAQAAYIRMGLAMRNLTELGIPAGQAPARMAEALVERGGWRPEQASEVVQSFVDASHAMQRELPAPEPTKYRLDEDGDDADLASILDEIDAAQKAAAELRACMAPAKPKGDA